MIPSLSQKRFKTDIKHVVIMYALLCRESGLDCDFVIRDETMEEFLKNGADRVIQKHGMRAEDIYLNDMPANPLCHSFNKET